jgi:hypothetical protein
MSDYQSTFQQVAFFAQETTAGTLKVPSAGDAVPISAGFTMSQPTEVTASEEVLDTFSVLSRVKGRFKAGKFKGSIMLMPSGTKGTAPAEQPVMKGLLGKETVVANTSVTYAPYTTLPTFSIWNKVGNSVFFASGATINSGKISVGAKPEAMIEVEGGFMQLGWVGTDTLDGSVVGSVIPVSNPKLFCVGGLVQLQCAVGGKKDNAGAGFPIVSVNIASGTVTVTGTPGAGLTGDTIEPFLPTATYTSNSTPTSPCTVLLGGVSAKIRNAELEIKNNIAYLEDEITSSGFPETFSQGKREVVVSTGLYFRSVDLATLYDAKFLTEKTFSMAIGSGNGKVVTISLPVTIVEAPEMAEASNLKAINFKLSAAGSGAGENEISIAYT